MTRIAYDTTDIPATVIPTTAVVVMGYVNGAEPSFNAVVARCPNAEHVSIAVSAHPSGGGWTHADMLDMETGDATPDEGEGWITEQKAQGVWRPSIYCPASWYHNVRNGTGHWVLGVDYDLILADWTGQPHSLGLGEAGVQYADPGQIPGHPNYDLTYIVDDEWPHRTQGGVVIPVPAPPPPPAPVPPPVVAPPFPLPPGQWYGRPNPDPRNHSGKFNPADRPGIAAFQDKLRSRGWGISVDGVFGDQTFGVVVAFQREKGLPQDGLVGPITWHTIWSAPVT